MNWLAHWLGLLNLSGPIYGFWSGSGSVFLPPLITLAGVAALWAWHHQCQVTGCYWPARRLTAANERACWRHHPHPQRTADDIRAAHHLYLGKQPGKG